MIASSPSTLAVAKAETARDDAYKLFLKASSEADKLRRKHGEGSPAHERAVAERNRLNKAWWDSFQVAHDLRQRWGRA